MAWYALRAVGESVSAARRLLAGASLSAWLRFAVLASFVGTLITPFLTDFNRGGSVLAALPETATAGLLAAAVVLGAAALCVGSVFEFVFLDALRGERIRLVADSARRFRAGLQVFALRVVLVALAGGLSVAVLSFEPPAALAVCALVLALACLAIDHLTRAFVVPIMLLEGCSLAAGWRAFSPALGAEWREYALYLLIAAALWAAIALGGGLLGALVALVVLVPFGALGTAVGGALVAQGLSRSVVDQAIIGTLLGPYLLVVLLLILLVHVPFVTYLRYVGLFVLGDTEERYDPIPRVRATIRRD
ncbi:hypothetical protein C497_13156 [Halalkalicoccus jeotgali B3]|uniref:Uncharacterized protein n=2 Tax=Halalkalicoccus jeotgali TaxID=413810 RepID=D8J3I0_HALJB|nr:hypothetical protein [Halalkalicoccus jeotgali]ADJ15287.1 hypothetical protein HacjB3_09520 [Halalkalicoccus jeotgali B3]ELY35292.1 hypothetical protein C497_13156 [Halalkalicoccus jeotgali B3]